MATWPRERAADLPGNERRLQTAGEDDDEVQNITEKEATAACTLRQRRGMQRRILIHPFRHICSKLKKILNLKS